MTTKKNAEPPAAPAPAPLLRIAIDPGIGGGIVVSTPEGEYHAHAMPSTPTELRDLMQHYWEAACVHYGCPALVLMELLGHFHRAGNSATASCKLARNYGQLEGVLSGMHFDVQLVDPKDWQRAHSPLPKEYAARKREMKHRMQLRHSNVPVTDATADAFGILAWHDTKQATR